MADTLQNVNKEQKDEAVERLIRQTLQQVKPVEIKTKVKDEVVDYNPALDNTKKLPLELKKYVRSLPGEDKDKVLRYLDIFKQDTTPVIEYINDLRRYGSLSEAKKQGSSQLLNPNKFLKELKNQPDVEEDFNRLTINLLQGNEGYDISTRDDLVGRQKQKLYQGTKKYKVQKGISIALESSARNASRTIAAMYDAAGGNSDALSYLEQRWPEVNKSREGIEQLSEDLTQFGLSVFAGKKVIGLFGKVAGKVAPGFTSKVINKLKKGKLTKDSAGNIKVRSSIAQKLGYWGAGGAIAYGVGEIVTGGSEDDKTIVGDAFGLSETLKMKNTEGLSGAEGTALIGGLTLGIKKAVVPLGKKILESSKIVLNPIGDVVQKAIAPLIAYETKKSRIGLPMIPRGIAYGWNALRSKSGIPKMEDWQILNESFTGLKGFRNRALRAIDRKFLAPTRARRYLPKELARIKKAQEGMLRDERKKVDLDLRNLEKNIYKLADVGMTTRIIGTSGNVGGQQYWQQVINYLRGGDINAVDKILRENVKNIRGQIDKLTMKLHPYIEDEKIAEELINGLQKYLTTSYQIFQGSFKPNKEIRKQAVQWFKDQIKRTDSRFANVKLTSPTLAKEAERRVADIITRGGQPFEGTTAQERLNAIVRDVIAPSGILKSKTKIPEIVQKLMGKVEDPRSIILNTITNQATLLGHIQANKKIVEQGLKYGYIFKDPADRTLKEIARLTGATLVKIKPNKGSSFLNLDDIYTYTQKTVKKIKRVKI